MEEKEFNLTDAAFELDMLLEDIKSASAVNEAFLSYMFEQDFDHPVCKAVRETRSCFEDGARLSLVANMFILRAVSGLDKFSAELTAFAEKEEARAADPRTAPAA